MISLKWEKVNVNCSHLINQQEFSHAYVTFCCNPVYRMVLNMYYCLMVELLRKYIVTRYNTLTNFLCVA